MPITPANVALGSRFLNDYKNAANAYKDYNISNKIGNSHYRASATIAPYNSQQLIRKTYGK